MININDFQKFIQDHQEKSQEFTRIFVTEMLKWNSCDRVKDMDTILDIFQEISDENIKFSHSGYFVIPSNPMWGNFYHVPRDKESNNFDLIGLIVESLSLYPDFKKLEFFNYWKSNGLKFRVKFDIYHAIARVKPNMDLLSRDDILQRRNSLRRNRDDYWSRNYSKFMERLRDHFPDLDISLSRNSAIDIVMITWRG